MIYADGEKKLQKPAGRNTSGFRKNLNMAGKLQFTPQVLHVCALQELQAGALWVMVRPSEWAKNKESKREVFLPSQSGQAIGASASFIERKASNCVRQSVQAYS
jgi:hypothetical protein